MNRSGLTELVKVKGAIKERTVQLLECEEGDKCELCSAHTRAKFKEVGART